MSDRSFTAQLYHNAKWSRDPRLRAQSVRMLKAIREENRARNRRLQRRLGRKRPFEYWSSVFGDDYRWTVSGVADNRFRRDDDDWAWQRVRAMQRDGAQRATPVRPRYPDSTVYTSPGDSNPAVVVRPGKAGRVVSSLWIAGPFTDSRARVLQAVLRTNGYTATLSQQQGERNALLRFPRSVPYAPLKSLLSSRGYTIARIQSY